MIKFENVSKTYPNGVKGLKNINLEIEQGEFVSIIGLSGAGKSTLIRTINRMIEITEGTLTVDGTNVSSLKGKSLRKFRRNKVGMIFQSFNLVTRTTVIKNVLTSIVPDIPFVRSLARTLAQNPEIILADEPVAALDPITAKRVMEDFKKINQELNISILLNIHHVELALEYADRIIGIRDGEIVYDGPSSQVTKEVLDLIYKGKAEELHEG